MTHLYIDDLRSPPSRKWAVARSYDAVIWHIENVGLPLYLSFDHDLGDDVPSGYDIAKMLIDYDLDGKIDLSKVIQVNVHSANPVGAENIREVFSSYFRFRESEGTMAVKPLIT